MWDSNDQKYLTVSQLKKVLNTLPDDHMLYPNSVKNLTIYKKNDNGSLEYFGIIDFLLKGEVELGPCKLIFEKNNGIAFGQDHSFFVNIPVDIKFVIDDIINEMVKLTADGYGLIGGIEDSYGNGSIYVSIDKLSKEHRKIVKRWEKYEKEK